ncbi:hypothetical protein CPB83DRAFT_838317 [Crepidotus variabilis]|uniref:Uncharacterized protein n=1 Tax=Crepidotus variabilis TaxID=179855 RepID=A0A9P6JM11_9AGAR|nr:hypothetical protein CPB83DRAFT_838317 [Crepidotus variabilis]
MALPAPTPGGHSESSSVVDSSTGLGLVGLKISDVARLTSVGYRARSTGVWKGDGGTKEDSGGWCEERKKGCRRASEYPMDSGLVACGIRAPAATRRAEENSVLFVASVVDAGTTATRRQSGEGATISDGWKNGLDDEEMHQVEVGEPSLS